MQLRMRPHAAAEIASKFHEEYSYIEDDVVISARPNMVFFKKMGFSGRDCHRPSAFAKH